MAATLPTGILKADPHNGIAAVPDRGAMNCQLTKATSQSPTLTSGVVVAPNLLRGNQR
jgi:hypothetical protein